MRKPSSSSKSEAKRAAPKAGTATTRPAAGKRLGAAATPHPHKKARALPQHVIAAMGKRRPSSKDDEEMVFLHEIPEPDPKDPRIAKVVDYLGGTKVVKAKIESRLDVNDLIQRGIPGEALHHVVRRTRVLDKEKLGRALGMSTRTIDRRQDAISKPLSPEQGDKTWKFSELMVRATAVLGSEVDAEKWFDEPAIALDQRKPIDLLGSAVGAGLVEELLGRMEYGVYT